MVTLENNTVLNLTVNDVIYDVGIIHKSLERSFEINEGDNSFTSLTGEKKRDILGTSYSYEFQVVPLPGHEDEYLKLYDILTTPAKYHKIRLPYGQRYIEFLAIIKVTNDVYKGYYNGRENWSEMRVSATPYKYQKLAKDM